MLWCKDRCTGNRGGAPLNIQEETCEKTPMLNGESSDEAADAPQDKCEDSLDSLPPKKN